MESLESLRREFPGEPLVFIVGMDSFQRLDRWHRWQEFTRLAHLVVAHRPGGALPGPGPVADFLDEHRCDDVETMMAKPAGHVMICALPLLDVSATRMSSEILRRETADVE